MALQESVVVDFLPVAEALYELGDVTSVPCISSLSLKTKVYFT